MTLAQAIERAQRANEQKLSRIAAQRFVPEVHELRALQLFEGWARSRGVKALPTSPVVLATYVASEAEAGIPAEEIAEFLATIIRWHDAYLLANPVASAPVKAQLQALFSDQQPLASDGPRSWSKSERVVWAGLPAHAQQIILRHSKLDSDAVRKAQNHAAALKQELESLQKENTNGRVCEKVHEQRREELPQG
jgi:hypothetical protein